MPYTVSSMTMVIPPMPTAHFGSGAISALPGIVQRAGADAVVIVTDAALATTPVVPGVAATLESGGISAEVFSGVHPNPSTADLATGADAAAALAAQAGRIMLVAVGGGSAIDAAKGIALAAVNPQRGRGLDYRHEFSRPALPIVAVPTTAGTGAETNAFGVVTDPQTGRKFYVGHASSRPAAAILDPELTHGLPPGATAATGMDALTHALESSMSRRANPWSDGIARQVIRMVGAHLPRAVQDGADREARAQMLLAAHLAGVGMATTGLGVCHAIGHALGGRFGIPHGVALTMVLPAVLRFNRPACAERLADVAFALGAGDTAHSTGWNATAAIEAISALAAAAGMIHRLSDFGITPADFDQIAADALDDEVLANTPRMPTGSDIREMLAAPEIA
ncbi:MAG TPA: iron-containing alcohol dehydrogenase [Streptosporangiaceae bacterium]|jgi:alcohol dehydrogenase